MKLIFLLCLTAVVNCHVALAKKKGGLLTILNKHKNTKPKDDFKSKPNLYNQGGSVHKPDIPGSHQRPQQPAPGQGGIGEHGGYGGYPAQGGYPGQGQYPAQGGYPRQGQYPAQGGYPGQGQYPAQGGYPGHGQYPAQGGYPGQGHYPVQGGYPGHGQYPAQGGYPGHGGYINQNPINHILSPHYGSSYGGYGGYAPGRGSPYSRTVQAMGYVPSEKSKGFGRSAMMAGAGGAVAGMALGYGLGRFPRPHFNFRSPEEEYFYNYYMYRRYGLKSPDRSDFRRDFKAPPGNYEQFMSSCMRRKDILPSPKKSKLTTKTPPTTITTTTSTTSTTSTTTSVSPSVSSNMTRPMTANNSTSAVPTTSDFPKPSEASPGASPGARPEASPGARPEASPGAAAVMAASYTDGHEDDDDTVSVVEIGYPALIEQLKVRRCLALYIVYSEKYLRKTTTQSPRGGGQRWESPPWLLLVLTIVTLIMAH